MSYRPAKKFAATIAGISALALVLTACGSSSSTSSTSSSAASSAAGTSAAAEASTGAAAPAGPVAASIPWCDTIKSTYGDLTGKNVGIYSTIVAPEAQPYIESFKPFEQCTGAKVTYEGSKEFEAQVVVRVQSGNPPDVALFPQPGLLQQIVESTGAVKPLQEDTKALATQYFPKDWLNYGTVNDIQFGVPNNADFKSLVWYSPKTFAAKGYTVPTTWSELTALNEKIVASGEKPWCIGIKSGEATGWQLTDWLEEYVLRTAGPDVYDQWISHEVKFSDAQIADALKQMGDLIKNPKYVNAGIGDVNTIASTEFNDVAAPLLNGQCYMSRQSAAFDTNYKSSKIGPDGDINAFYFPPISTSFGNVVLGGGTFWSAFADRPEVNAFMYYVTTPDYANSRAQLGSWLSSNLGLQASSVPSPIGQTALGILQDPDTVFRFDASDLMPAQVGSDAEWKQFTAWITGQDDATTLAKIDAAWPTS